jgi:hypothetical protein
MDHAEQMVMESEVSAVVLGGQSGEFILCDLGGEIDSAMQAAQARGLRYMGVLSIARGVATANCDSDPEAIATLMSAAIVFGAQNAGRLRPPQQDDFLEFAERLWSLDDPRPEA